MSDTWVLLVRAMSFCRTSFGPAELFTYPKRPEVDMPRHQEKKVLTASERRKG